MWITFAKPIKVRIDGTPAWLLAVSPNGTQILYVKDFRLGLFISSSSLLSYRED